MPVPIPTAENQFVLVGNRRYVSVSDGSGRFVFVKDYTVDRGVRVGVIGEADALAGNFPTERVNKEQILPGDFVEVYRIYNGKRIVVADWSLRTTGEWLSDAAYFSSEDIPSTTPQIVRSALKPDFNVPGWLQWIQSEKDFNKWEVTVRLWVKVDESSAMPMVVRTEPLPEASHDSAGEVSPGVFKAILPDGTTITYRTSTSRGFNDLDLLQFPAGLYIDISWEILDSQKNKIGNFGTANGGSSVNSFMTGLSQGFTTPFPVKSAFIRYTLTKSAGGTTVFDAPILD
jgi:hypothetical protein